MTIPILMLLLMTGPYLAARAVSAATGRQLDRSLAANLGLTLLFAFTGFGHFVKTGAMVRMLPPWMPEPATLVYLTGFGELVVAAGFPFRKTRRYAGWVAAAMLVVFLPINVYAAFRHVQAGGHAWGPLYLLVRVPLQAAMLAWVWRFALNGTAGKR